MTGRIVNRKEKRAEVEAAEREAAAKPEKPAKKTAKTATKRKTAKRAEARVRLFWGVFNQSMKRVALYDFNQKKQAEKKAADLTKSSKNYHFVQRIKEAIQE